MILTPQQIKELEMVARPLIAWLNNNGHPHMTAIVEVDRITLKEDVAGIPIKDYIKD